MAKLALNEIGSGALQEQFDMELKESFANCKEAMEQSGVKVSVLA